MFLSSCRLRCYSLFLVFTSSEVFLSIRLFPILIFNKELDDVINVICMMGKYHIHKARYLTLKPSCKILASDLHLL